MMRKLLSSIIHQVNTKEDQISMSLTTNPCSIIDRKEHLTRIDARIILLAMGMFALGTDAFIIAGVLPLIAHDTGASEAQVGQLITVFALTYGLGAPVLAATTAHWPRHRVLMGALGLLGLAWYRTGSPCKTGSGTGIGRQRVKRCDSARCAGWHMDW
jgi:cyanate permease